jgi:hypothetical protein
MKDYTISNSSGFDNIPALVFIDYDFSSQGFISPDNTAALQSLKQA